MSGRNSNGKITQTCTPPRSIEHNSVEEVLLTRLERIIQWCNWNASNLNSSSYDDPLLGEKLRSGLIQMLLEYRKPQEVNIKLTSREEEVLTAFFEDQTRQMCSGRAVA